MKLLFENWRQFITEDWRDTSWEADDEKVTIGDVVDYLGDETVDVNVLELSQQLPPLPTRGAERVAAASLEYPVIVVKSGGQYRFVLDGNHRLQKAIDEKVESIKAKILDLDNPETPEVFKRMFGSAQECKTVIAYHGSPEEFNKFSMEYAKGPKALYFTTSRDRIRKFKPVTYIYEVKLTLCGEGVEYPQKPSEDTKYVWWEGDEDLDGNEVKGYKMLDAKDIKILNVEEEETVFDWF